MVEKSHTAGWFPGLYEPLRNLGHKVADWFAPPSDASTMENYYEINVELPGVKPENVDVSIHDNNLLIGGEKRYEHEESGRTYFFSEREFGKFQRSFRLPPDADGDHIDATFNDGVLRIRIARLSATEPAGRKVEVLRA